MTMSHRTLRLWWHNNVKVRWYGLTFRMLDPLYRKWIREGRDPKLFPRPARITPEALAWADSVTLRVHGEEAK